MSTHENYGAELFAALRDGRTVPPLIARDSGLTIDDAYQISLDFLSRRRAEGERVVGKKIGVTSKAVQDMLGVHQPDFGFLTDPMHVEGDISIADKKLIQPRAEAEIAFILRDGLKGPGITAADVVDATEAIAAFVANAREHGVQRLVFLTGRGEEEADEQGQGFSIHCESLGLMTSIGLTRQIRHQPAITASRV